MSVFKWVNGAETHMTVTEDGLLITDIHSRFVGGESNKFVSVSEALELVEQHKAFAKTLESAAREQFLSE